MRGKKAKKRVIKPDHKYNSEVLTKFINYVMLDGKKSVAENVVYDALEGLAVEKKGEDGKTVKYKSIEVFLTALDNVKPRLEIRSRRIGGANYQVPVPVSPDRQSTLAMRWILTAARTKRKHGTFAESLRNELMAAFKGEGDAIKKMEDTVKMAEANKAFAQFA